GFERRGYRKSGHGRSAAGARIEAFAVMARIFTAQQHAAPRAQLQSQTQRAAIPPPTRKQVRQMPVLKIRHPGKAPHRKPPAIEIGRFKDDVAAMLLTQATHRRVTPQRQGAGEASAAPARHRRGTNQTRAEQLLEADAQQRFGPRAAKHDGLVANVGMAQQRPAYGLYIVDAPRPNG